MINDNIEVVTPCRPMPPPRKKGTFVPRERPRAATEKPVPYVGPDGRLFVEYISGVMPGPVIGLAGQNVEASEATALVATDGTSMVRVAQEKVQEFLRLHANHLLVPSDPEWFMTALGFPADAWERVPDSDTPAPSVQFIALPVLLWALLQKNERVVGIRVEAMAQVMAFSRGAGQDEMEALRGLLEAGLTANTTDSLGRLAGCAAAALLLYRLFLRRIQRRGRRRDKFLARLARYRAQMPAALQEQLFGSVQIVTSEPVVSSETAAPAPALVECGR